MKGLQIRLFGRSCRGAIPSPSVGLARVWDSAEGSKSQRAKAAPQPPGKVDLPCVRRSGPRPDPCVTHRVRRALGSAVPSCRAARDVPSKGAALRRTLEPSRRLTRRPRDASLLGVVIGGAARLMQNARSGGLEYLDGGRALLGLAGSGHHRPHRAHARMARAADVPEARSAPGIAPASAARQQCPRRYPAPCNATRRFAAGAYGRVGIKTRRTARHPWRAASTNLPARCQLGSPLGSPPPEHQPYLVQRDATPRVGRAPCRGALPLATPRGPSPAGECSGYSGRVAG